jgi:glucose/arabinose dehydrogenase
MNRMQAIVFSIIAAAAIGIGIAVPFGVGSNTSGTVEPDGSSLPGNNETDPGTNSSGFTVLPDSDLPSINDAGLRIEKVAEGLALPTSMAFLDEDDLLILQKDNGRIRHISDGKLQDDPVHDVFVNNDSERGLLGIAVAGGTNSTNGSEVFLYFTEEDGEIKNRVYRYNWSGDGRFSGSTLILDLPGTPGPNHDGGKLRIGPDGMLYAVIGDLNRNGVLQNYPNGDEPDDTSVILRVDSSGAAASDTVLTDGSDSVNDSLSRYYAYGVRNSFGMDFDPLTGNLWDTENGPSGYDEINLVRPGFNSGWEKVMGPMDRSRSDEGDLVKFNGSHYRDPAFSWLNAQGITDIEFLNSTSLGDKYANNIFVGDINNGNLYFFELNEERDGLTFDSVAAGLEDLVADNNAESDLVTIGTGFQGITDIETGPDGYLYILTFGGNLYRIVPQA